MRIAITRKVSPNIGRCELTHLRREPIDVVRAEQQHLVYERVLSALGLHVCSLPPQPDLPDSVFVEDAAVVFDELAVITRPGAESRRPEIPSVAEALRPYRELHFLVSPATLDGGDVLCVGRDVYIGLSGRTNESAVGQMRNILEPYGYEIKPIAVKGCLHLKSAVTQVSDDALLINPAWVPADAFAGLDVVAIAPSEPHAANALRIGDTIVYPAGFPETQRRLEHEGLRVMAVPVSELSKAEGAVTCCSLIFSASARSRD